MLSQTRIGKFLLASLLVGVLGNEHADAQSMETCGALPYLGVGGPEICISITQNTPGFTPIYFRVPVLPGLAGPTLTAVSAGEYTVDTMTVNYVSGPTGMAIGMTGAVTRSSPGNAWLTIKAIGGWGTPIVGGAGTITVTGSATGTSSTKVGGAAGRPTISFPSQDVTFNGFNRIAEGTTLGAGGFSDATPPQPIQPPGATTVAAYMSVSFHLNDVGTTTNIPAGVGIAPVGATPPTASTGRGGKPHFECYDVNERSPMQKEREVKLADQFAEAHKRVGRITRICTPVDKNGEGIPDPKLHLVCYRILEGHDANRPVETANQFGKAQMVVRKATELCVPSTKKLLGENKQQKKR